MRCLLEGAGTCTHAKRSPRRPPWPVRESCSPSGGRALRRAVGSLTEAIGLADSGRRIELGVLRETVQARDPVLVVVGGGGRGGEVGPCRGGTAAGWRTGVACAVPASHVRVHVTVPHHVVLRGALGARRAHDTAAAALGAHDDGRGGSARPRSRFARRSGGRSTCQRSPPTGVRSEHGHRAVATRAGNGVRFGAERDDRCGRGRHWRGGHRWRRCSGRALRRNVVEARAEVARGDITVGLLGLVVVGVGGAAEGGAATWTYNRAAICAPRTSGRVLDDGVYDR